jgi:hypothetical protein
MEAARRGALLSGTLLLLTTLKKRGNAIGIITRNCHAALMNVFPQIEDYCDVLLSRDQAIHVKPHPDHSSEHSAFWVLLRNRRSWSGITLWTSNSVERWEPIPSAS